MEAIRWLAAVVVGGFALGLILFNWRCCIMSLNSSEPDTIPVPLLAGVLGLLTLLAMPVEESMSIWWLPFVVDYGSIPYTLRVAFGAALR